MRTKIIFRHKSSLIATLVPLSAAVILSACGSSSSATKSSQSNTVSAAPSGQPIACKSYDTVTYGAVGSITDAGLILANRLGYFHQYCINFKFQRITTAPALTSALASNAIQAAGISEAPGLFTGIAKGIDMRIVGDKQSCTSSTCADGLLVRNSLVGSTEAETWANAKGKTLALAATGDAVMYDIDLLLKPYGLSTSDFHLVLEPFPDIVGALKSGQADVGFELEPFITKALATGCCKFYSQSEVTQISPATNPPTLVPLVYGPELLNPQNQQEAQNFMNAYMLGVRAYNDAVAKNKNQQQIFELIASDPIVNVSVASYAQMHKPYLDPNQLATGSAAANTISYLGKLQAYFVSTGAIKKGSTVDPSKMLDLSFAKNAVKRFGAYS